mmetsp:Transcript_8724/g.14692  ORF Transcript_8724/g.14692 Transcript_8724/m.14692 type:complete len:454 (+) Transcript_8724:513-1874(+)
MVETAEVQSICCSLAMGRLRCAASSASVGVREYLCDSSRFALRSELTRSCMCTGSRIVREWSAMARVIACRIHHVAYVERRKPRAASNFSAALISPIEPSWIRSCSVSPWFMYFFAIETTRRRLAETSSCFAFCMRCCSRTYSAAPPARPRSAAHSSFVGTRSSRSVRAPRASSHCSSCCTAADRWLTSSGESSRCLPMFLRYQRIESSPLPAVEKTGSGGPPLAASGAGAGAGAGRGQGWPPAPRLLDGRQRRRLDALVPQEHWQAAAALAGGGQPPVGRGAAAAAVGGGARRPDRAARARADERRVRCGPRPCRRGRRVRSRAAAHAEGEAAARLGQPAPGGLDREKVHEPGADAAGPDPGGLDRADQGGREVRRGARLPPLHVRHVVDPAGDHARHRRPLAHDPAAGAHARPRQLAAQGEARAVAQVLAHADRRRARRAPQPAHRQAAAD